MLKSIFFIGIALLSLGCNAQTGPEKVAAALCGCAENDEEYAAAVKLLRSGDMKVIKERFDEIHTQFFKVKRCAKKSVILTKEEGEKVDEDEIEAALIKNCPDVAFLGDECRRISSIIEKEQKQLDLAERHRKIERHLAKKEFDSVRYELDGYHSMYGFESDRGPEIVGYYYQIGDFVQGNAVAMTLIDNIKNEYFIYDDRENQTVPINEFIKTGLLAQAKKFKQQEVIDALK
ncbi:MAG: hypothetical protein V4604_02220 [Bacteroidota bacterium]